MGLRFRKSINLGGLRLNLSNSGVGYSIGKKGVRISRSATGRTTSTVSIPGTGLSYTQNLGDNKKSVKKTQTKNTDKNISNYNVNRSTVNPYNTTVNDGLNTYSSSNIKYNTTLANSNISYNKAYVNLNNEDFIKKLRNKKGLDIFSTILLLFAILFFISKIFLIIGGIGLLIKIIMLFNKVIIDFDTTEQGKILYTNMNDILIKLSKNKMIWSINETKTMREVVKISKKYPWYVNNKANIHYIKLKNEKIYFTPEYLVVEKGGLVKGYSYTNIGITNTYDECREEGVKPIDAVVIGESFKYVNKDGMPDKRFSYNPKIPVCNYGCLVFDLPDKDYEIVYSNMNSGIDSNLQSVDQILTNNISNNVSNKNLFDSEFEDELARKEQSLRLERKLEEEKINNLTK